MAAGLSATIILTIFMLINRGAHIVPQADPIQALVKVSTLWLGSPLAPWVGWAEHFFIGTVAWGIAYPLLEPMLAGASWMRGILFAIGAWILMMVLLMPPAGAGWFGAALGAGVPLSALVMHIMYGFCLGAFYTHSGVASATRPRPERPAGGKPRTPIKAPNKAKPRRGRIDAAVASRLVVDFGDPWHCY